MKETSGGSRFHKETYDSQVLQAIDFYLFTTNINKLVPTIDIQMIGVN